MKKEHIDFLVIELEQMKDDVISLLYTNKEALETYDILNKHGKYNNKIETLKNINDDLRKRKEIINEIIKELETIKK